MTRCEAYVVEKCVPSNRPNQLLRCKIPSQISPDRSICIVHRDGLVDIRPAVRNLVSMNDHVDSLAQPCNYQLRRIKSFRRSLHTTTVIALVYLFIISRVDYCNSILTGVSNFRSINGYHLFCKVDDQLTLVRLQILRCLRVL